MSTAKTPLFHVVKREGSFARGLLVRIAAIALALIVCAVIIVLLTGMNPLNVYGALINGAGIFLLEVFLYTYEVITGHMIWYDFGKDYFLYAVVVLPMIVVLPVAAVYSRKLYKETGSIYTGAFLNAMLFTWFVVGNTCYHFPNV